MTVIQGYGGFHEMPNHSPINFGNTEITKATFDDMQHVWRIVYHAYSTYIPLLGRTPPTFNEDFDGHVSLGNLWLCWVNGEASAMVVLTPHTDHLLIQALCVDPEKQGLGLGRRLLAFAEHSARTAGLNTMRLYTNSRMERNLRIYEKWGFNITGREEYGWGERVHMHKRIARSRKTNSVKTPSVSLATA